MTNLFKLSALALLLSSTNLYAHHPAADIVDEEIYEMIDTMVADTPHASLTFDEMGAGMTETTITVDTMDEFETLITEEGLLEYVEVLDGVVDVDISFNDDSSVTLTVNQVR